MSIPSSLESQNTRKCRKIWHALKMLRLVKLCSEQCTTTPVHQFMCNGMVVKLQGWQAEMDAR